MAAAIESLYTPKVAQFVAAVLCFGVLVCLLDTSCSLFLWEGMVKAYTISLSPLMPRMLMNVLATLK